MRSSRKFALLRSRLAFLLQGLRAAGLPFHVPDLAGLVGADVGVSAEVVALGLNQVAGETAAAVGVVVGERRAEGRRGDAVGNAGADDAPPGVLAGGDRVLELLGQQQIRQVGV